MNEDCQIVDQALQTLKARPRGRVTLDVALEDRLMQELGKLQRQRRRRWTMAVAASLVLLVSGVGFAAAGGIEIVQGWFGQIELVDSAGNQPTLNYELQGTQLLDANGNAVGELSLSGGNEEQQAVDAAASR